MGKSESRSFRLSPVLLAKLQEISELKNRSLSNLVETILKEYIEEYMLWADPEFREALKESESDEGIPWREAMGNV